MQLQLEGSQHCTDYNTVLTTVLLQCHLPWLYHPMSKLCSLMYT